MRACDGRACTAPRPPSVVAEPPTATSTRRAPAATASAINSPVPAVVALTGSLPDAPPARDRPEASAISMTATPRLSRHGAVTGSPSGPVTTDVRLGPPSASSVPSPPSAIGAVSQDAEAAAAASATAAATSTAEAVPRNLSGAASTCTPDILASYRGWRNPCRRPLNPTFTQAAAGASGRSLVGARSCDRAQPDAGSGSRITLSVPTTTKMLKVSRSWGVSGFLMSVMMVLGAGVRRSAGAPRAEATALASSP